MLKITGLKVDIITDGKQLEKEIIKKAASKLKVNTSDIKSFNILKKSIDARKGEVKYIFSIEVSVNKEESLLKKKYIINDNNIMLTNNKKYSFIPSGEECLNSRPVVVGSGPAGLFCGYMLALNGYNPIIIERGKDVDERDKSVNSFWNGGKLDTESNVQFGEGGAGTFSDGKLNTLVNDKLLRNTYVLDTFVKFGAPENIKYDSKPHIGTDILKTVVKNMRNEIIRLGGNVMFEHKLVDFSLKDGKLTGIKVEHKNEIKEIACDVMVLAIGHSARDTFEMLSSNRLIMTPKAFAVGVRIEHPQEMINRNQYGDKYFDKLPAAPYKLAKTLENGRNVYSFCMCPGGYVVNASSEENMVAVNGMSYSNRDSCNANTALIVNVTPDDFGDTSPLAGIEYQRKLERLAYKKGGQNNNNIPIQLFGDFKANRVSKELKDIIPCVKGKYEMANLKEILPAYVSESLEQGIEQFANVIKGYNRYDAVMLGVESRTSSPVRITRNEDFLANYDGIYPCGEGAGYAGGITSAAMDGIKVSEAIMKRYAGIDV